MQSETKFRFKKEDMKVNTINDQMWCQTSNTNDARITSNDMSQASSGNHQVLYCN